MGSRRNGQTSSGVVALMALAVGVGVVALIDFGGIAGQGVRVGQFVLALAPWVLAVSPGSQLTHRPLEGAVAFGWVILMGGAIGLGGAFANWSPLSITTGLTQAMGAMAVLWVLYRGGHYGLSKLLFFISAGLALGVGLVYASFSSLYESAAPLVSNFLVSTHLFPQLVHDSAVVLWGWRTGSKQRMRASLEGVGMPFILWTMAGHLIIAPAILYWSPIPKVLFGAIGAGIALLLFVVRGSSGVFKRSTVIGLILITVAYGIGLAMLVKGHRPY
ncbi:MAG: hypothetical protein KTR25_16705 [Myxococcales bacterium]|nr:hypothetical protein [Myxococcales bacterium]